MRELLSCAVQTVLDKQVKGGVAVEGKPELVESFCHGAKRLQVQRQRQVGLA